ncbi:MAG: hypothetical protein COA70_08570 [Planctomycetota bacterium]|nr:MAG: hypothetical protein COA70_08560 [Planctomycetota bacterium]PCJ53732.1 MAG: hypothetical protein COA70_08570 [Planctomycetota bacterium]
MSVLRKTPRLSPLLIFLEKLRQRVLLAKLFRTQDLFSADDEYPREVGQILDFEVLFRKVINNAIQSSGVSKGLSSPFLSIHCHVGLRLAQEQICTNRISVMKKKEEPKIDDS